MVILVVSACGSGTGSADVSLSASPLPPSASSSTSPSPSLVAFGPVTEVTGTEECGLNEGELRTTEADGTMHYRKGSAVCSKKSSDPRLAGGVYATWSTDRWESGDDGALVQWGTATIENAGGTWVGTYTGVATTASGDALTFWYTGTGDYAGLSYYEWQILPMVNGVEEGVHKTHGLIFPGTPPTP